MYLPGKSNQNTHITSRAPEDWQQLNLSVKNVVKELKTFDLPVSCRYLCLSPAFVFLEDSHFHHSIYTLALFFVCTPVLSNRKHVGLCTFWLVPACIWQHEDISKWRRGSRGSDSRVCGLITINSPFDCN